jgi:hypothetical protein
MIVVGFRSCAGLCEEDAIAQRNRKSTENTKNTRGFVLSYLLFLRNEMLMNAI